MQGAVLDHPVPVREIDLAHRARPGHVTARAHRVAIVHDWCPDFRGGERVLAQLCRIFEGADVYTLFDFLSPDIKQLHFPDVTFHASVANRIPHVKSFYRSLFPICPFLIEQFDVTDYDAVVSSSAAFARGVLTRPDQPHLCYVHTPIRYAWDEQFSYYREAHIGFGPRGVLFRYLMHRLRIWDTRTANGPDLMVANSNYVRARIKRIYGCDAQVIFPPVEIEELSYTPEKDDYYVTASFLAPYKRTDLVIQAFNAMPKRRLIVVGEGQQAHRLRSIAGPNVRFTGYLSRDDYVHVVARARAFVFAGCEDFGIAMAEAQACGTPVLAFRRGGAADIVRPMGSPVEPTGILFDRQSAEAIEEAVDCFERRGKQIAPATCRENAMRFSPARFSREIAAAFETVCAGYSRWN